MINGKYELRQVLYENNSTLIYKAHNIHEKIPVIIKAYKNPEDSYILKYEYDILKSKRIKGIVNVINLEYDENTTYLIMEDKRGVVLTTYLEENILEEADFVTIAKNAASSLASIHESHIIHRDIKPSNILIEPETLHIWYIDFGISIDLEEGKHLAKNGLQGTLEYIPPEQTGRIDMEVDERSDLYSFGVTLYQLATGKLPFQGSTSMELIHAHIAILPKPPSQVSQVNQTLSDIIMKLLKKMPEERYQTAKSLEKDLSICNSILGQGGTITPFPLGTGDAVSLFTLDSVLYGKENELQELKSVFDEIIDKRGELIVLEGLPGTGKSVLAAEFETYVRENNGCFIRGKYDRITRNEPFYALKEAIQHYLEYAEQTGINIVGLRDILVKRLGENTGALNVMFPMLEEYLGEQPPLIPLSFIENQYRNEQAYRMMLQTVSSPAHPMVMFLDNVHLADYQSLQLYFSALSDKDTKNLIFLWGIRSNEIEQNPDLVKMLASLEHADFPVHRIRLNYLSQNNIKVLLKDTYGDALDDIETMAEFIYEATDGRPYEIMKLLKLLGEKKLFTYQESQKKIIWDLESIRNANLNFDVKSSYEDILNRYNEREKQVLMVLSACSGELKESFIDTCFEGEIDTTELKQIMDKFIEDELFVNPYTSYYSFEDRLFRIYCYNLQPEEQRENIHYKIGMNLYRRFADDNKQMEHYISAITDHLNSAGRAATCNESAYFLGELNQKAGNQAASAGDSMKALTYYKKGIDLLGDNGFAENYELTFELYLKSSECYFANGNYDICNDINMILLMNADNERDRYLVYSGSMRQYMSMGHFSQVVIYGKEFLKGKGLLLEELENKEEALASEREYYDEQVAYRDAGYFMDFKFAEDGETLQNGNILVLMTSAMWTNGHADAEYYHLRASRYACENGLFDGFETIYENGALRMALSKNYKRAEELILAALEYCQRHNAPKSNAYIYYCSQIIHWLKPVRDAVQIYLRAKNCALLEGKLHSACYAEMIRLDSSAFLTDHIGHYMKEVVQAMDYAKKINYDFCYQIFYGAFKQSGQCLLGKTEGGNSFNDKNFNEAEYLEENKNQPTILAYYFSYKLLVLSINGCYEDAMPAIGMLNQLNRALGGLILLSINNFFHSFVLLHLCEEYPERTEEYLKVVNENQKQMEYWVSCCEENFLSRYLFIKMEIARLEGNTEELMSLYSKIQTLFYTPGESSYMEGLLEESMAKYWEKKGISQYAYYHRNRSYQIFKSIKFIVKAQKLVQENDTYHGEAFDLRAFSTVSSSTFEGTSPISNHNLDSEMILKIIGLLSHDLDITALSNKLLSILIQSSGASKGFIAVCTESTLVLEAAYFSDYTEEQLSALMLPVIIDRMDDKLVPIQAIEQVMNKKITITVNSAEERYLFFNDGYFTVHNPESIICTPILLKSNTIGVIYLENEALQGVFTEDRVNLIHTINMQSAVILQNAVYYNELSTYAKTVEMRLKEHTNIQNSLIAGIAHEINTPIGVCVTVISRMEELTNETKELFHGMKLSKSKLSDYLDKSWDGLHIASMNIKRAVELISNFKKVSVDQSNEAFEEVNLYETLNNIAEYIRPAIKKKINKIDIIGDKEFQMVTCSGALTQIFTNLIMNSVIHGFEDKDRDQCKITIRFKKRKNNVQLVYSDNGKGMSEEQLNKLFQPFYTTKRNQGGSGLGTHIISTLVTQKLNRGINCVSVPNNGTSFVMQIPFQNHA